MATAILECQPPVRSVGKSIARLTLTRWVFKQRSLLVAGLLMAALAIPATTSVPDLSPALLIGWSCLESV
jgi:hypothetical protein